MNSTWENDYCIAEQVACGIRQWETSPVIINLVIIYNLVYYIIV